MADKKKTDKKKEDNKLFNVFGEFDSMEQINSKAQEIKEQPEQLKELAKENGIEQDLADMYLQGFLPELIPSPDVAAIGKLDVEVAALSDKNMEVGSGIADYMKQKAAEDEKVARAIRKKGKSLEKICKDIWDEASKRRKGNCAYIPPFEVFQLARAYYLKEDKA